MPSSSSLLQTIAALSEIGGNPALWPDALARVAEAIGADAAFTVAHSGSSGCITNSWGIKTERLATYPGAASGWTGWLQCNGVVAPAPSVWMEEEIAVEGGPFAGSTFAADWLHAQGFHHVLIGVLAASKEAISAVVLARGRRRGRFSARAKTSLLALLPYLQDLAAGEAVRLTRTVEGAAIRALQVVALGVAIIRADGGLLFANAAANAVINNGDILSLRNGPLALSPPGRPGRFRELLTRFGSMIRNGKQSTPLASSVPRLLPHGPVSLLVWPLPEAAAAGPDEPVAIVFIGDPERAGKINSKRLHDLYGLSPKEARVAALLAEGHRLDEIAQILGVAHETVRKHIKNIFSKTGTRRQTDLTRILVSGPAALLDLLSPLRRL